MTTGMEWVGSNANSLGEVRVLLDDGSTTQMIKALDYVLSQLQPPIYELPFRSEDRRRSNPKQPPR